MAAAGGSRCASEDRGTAEGDIMEAHRELEAALEALRGARIGWSSIETADVAALRRALDGAQRRLDGARVRLGSALERRGMR